MTARAFDLLGIDRSGIISVTMPGFGTTDRTHDNATKLTESLGADLREVNIGDAVRLHFSDIGHDESVHDVTYENSQARERTQILMAVSYTHLDVYKRQREAAVAVLLAVVLLPCVAMYVYSYLLWRRRAAR